MTTILKMMIAMALLACASMATAEQTNPQCEIDANTGYLCCPWQGQVYCDPATGPD